MEVNRNDTTAFKPPADQTHGFPGYYALIPLVLLTLIGSILAAVRVSQLLEALTFILAQVSNYILLFRFFISERNQGRVAPVVISVEPNT